MFRWTIWSSVLVSLVAPLARAQAPARPTDPVFVRAQDLVSDGNGAAGRALVDSVINANSPASRIYPEALFWRATLAASAADAESDYKHIVVDYPLAPQAEDALLRLAQLELARGDRDGALGHLQRIPRDYPRSKSLARASYWTARVLFEKNDIPNACAANAAALAQAGAGEIELQNQIQYQAQRCTSYNVSRATANNPTLSDPVKTSGQASASSTPSTVVDNPLPSDRARVDTPSPPIPVESKEAKQGVTTQPKTEAVSKPATAAKSETRPISGNRYSVQVAAYNHRGEADKLASNLRSRGYEARVDGDVAPFRVRIGRYATVGQAEEALKKIKAKRMDGFVLRVPER
ncbi:MAG: SPOR domain-containing protein [Gemmatimonadaceae bacterium]